MIDYSSSDCTSNSFYTPQTSHLHSPQPPSSHTVTTSPQRLSSNSSNPTSKNPPPPPRNNRSPIGSTTSSLPQTMIPTHRIHLSSSSESPRPPPPNQNTSTDHSHQTTYSSHLSGTFPFVEFPTIEVVDSDNSSTFDGVILHSDSQPTTEHRSPKHRKITVDKAAMSGLLGGYGSSVSDGDGEDDRGKRKSRRWMGWVGMIRTRRERRGRQFEPRGSKGTRKTS
ncbi:hypothetical protein PQX77_012317 [Marasmius sp. AFHP31]|nr:hypothetical protein PQX77_012317 [Marasmius sp. AFHP31]